MKKQRMLALFLALSMLLTLLAPSMVSAAASYDVADPYALMYDSDARLKDELDEMIHSAGLQQDTESLLAEVFDLDASTFTDTGALDSATVDMLPDAVIQEIEAAVERSGEQRFIVKYKDAHSEQIASVLSTSELGSYDVEDAPYSTEIQVIEFDEKINPRELAEALSAYHFEREIEYIQPDFKVYFSSAPDDAHLTLDVEVNGGSVSPAESQTPDPAPEETTEPVEPELPEPAETPELPPEETSELPPEETSELPPEEPPELPPEETPELPPEETPELPPEETPELPPEETPELPVETAPTEPEELPAQVIVALIDTGVDIEHPDLMGSIWESEGVSGWNFYDDNAVLFDSRNPESSAHGTHIAGTILQNTENTQLMPLKVFGDNGAYTSDIIEAIQFAEEHGAQIVNCSFGCSEYNLALKEAMQGSDMLFVAAVGNGHRDLDESPVYPACFELDNLISVASINEDGGLSYFSNYSDTLADMAAVGRDVSSCLPGQEHGEMSGTSMAAAAVSNSAARVLEENLLLTTAELRERLVSTADMLSNLQGSVRDGRAVNTANAAENLVQDTVTYNNPEDDFDIVSYQLPYSEAYELFSSSKIKQVELAGEAVVTLRSDGTVWAWGYNRRMVCGVDGENYVSLTQIVGLQDVVQISAGTDYVLARKANGTVWAWGFNADGVLGDGTTNSSAVPVQVIGLTGVTDISAGSSHCLAVSSGTLYAWGLNQDGQLGTGTTTDRVQPVRIRLNNVRQVAAGDSHSLALLNDGTVYAWGYNRDGQLGDRTTVDKTEPTENLMTDAVAIAAGRNFSAAIDSTGAVYTWGGNSSGQLGNGRTVSRTYPIQASLNQSITKIAVGRMSCLALDASGSVWAWGENNGTLGLGTTGDVLTPTLVADVRGCAGIAVNATNSVFLQNDGTLWIAGENLSNQFGTSQPICYSTPTMMPALADAVTVIPGFVDTLKLTASGSAYGWGRNDYGQLGNGSTDMTSTPTEVAIPSADVLAIGSRHALAIRGTRGYVYAWGSNRYGQLGDGTTTDSTEPVRAFGVTGAEQAACGTDFSMVLTDIGEVYTWGSNRYGQLGDNTTRDSTEPTAADLASNITQIAAGDRHGMALDSRGRVWTWGYNRYGQLGDETTANSETPIRVSLSGITQIDAGADFSVALDSSGYVWAWGANRSGQLGDRTTTDSGLPAKVRTLSDVVKVSAGDNFCLALLSDGTVWGWGDNRSHQISASSSSEFTRATQISGLSNITDIVCGGSSCFAYASNGRIYAWGDDSYGQLGSQRLMNSLYPMKAHSYTPSLSFTNRSYSMEIPSSGSATIQLMASGSTDTGLVTSDMVVYSLASAYPGVTITSQGVLTVTSTAAAGTVTVKAAYGSRSCSVAVTLEKAAVEEGNTLTLSAVSGTEYYVSAGAQNYTSLQGKTFTVTYDPLVLQVVDLCALTYEQETGTGAIARTGVTITASTPGTISFTVNKTITAPNKWSGLLNAVLFRAKTSASTQITITEV